MLARVDDPAPLGEARPVAVPAGPRRRAAGVRWAAVVVALAGVAAAVGLGLAATGGEQDPTATGPDVGAWERLADPPVARSSQGQVWTGREVVRFGGYGDPGGPSTVASAYDPATGAWRRLPDLPEEATGANHGVWTGREVVAFPEQREGVAAAYDPEADSWRLISDPAIPYLTVSSSVVWTGDKVLVEGFYPSAAAAADTNDGTRRAGLYDPDTGSWEALPDAPVETGVASAVWTGRELVLVALPAMSPGGAPTSAAAPEPEMVAMALDPAVGTWRVLPAPPLAPREMPVVAWTGAEVVVAGGVLPPDAENSGGVPVADAAGLDPESGAWQPYPAPPVAVFGDDIPSQATVVTVGGQVVVLHTVGPDRRPLVLDTAARSWHYGAPLPGGLPEPRSWSAIATDTGVVLVAVDRAYAFTPPLPSGGRRSAG